MTKEVRPSLRILEWYSAPRLTACTQQKTGPDCALGLTLYLSMEMAMMRKMLVAMLIFAMLSVIGVMKETSSGKMLADMRMLGMIATRKTVSATQRRQSKQLNTVLEELKINLIPSPDLIQYLTSLQGLTDSECCR